MKFKVGDIVKLRGDSEFFGQFEGEGKIREIYDIRDDALPFKVETPSGYYNSYSEDDLELVRARFYHPRLIHKKK